MEFKAAQRNEAAHKNGEWGVMKHPIARWFVKPIFDFYCQVTEEQKEDSGHHGEGEKNWCV